ncbi:branched chain amino acid ABC transporter substrate-binding protein [Phaeobacter inhibens]|uniref:ABC transporter substrate-binding protein n=1 Tax=Phaeobacter inhibens TaxID=221822 RepID=UPI00276340F6|nr:ABC transporter substrate-binding protein [Phaeobacter inhibens]GLO70756.1 branched chain amino acid ABC transporter substrate-binding protein [Phaeobacter inhibens]
MTKISRLMMSCATALVLGAGASSAADKELTINIVASMSGAFANFGLQAEKGARLAIEEAGEAAGMPINMVVIDTESNAGKGARKVQASLSENGPGIFVGTTLSSTALAVGQTVHEAGGVYINGGGADELTGEKCNASMYRWSAPTYGAVNASLRPVLDAHPDIKRVYTITPQYVFGEAMLANTLDVLKENGIEHVGNSYHSLKDKEFSGFIAQAQASSPDLLVLLNFGSQAAASMQQAVNFGLKDRMKILMVWSNGLDTMQALGSDVSDGVYFGAQYWHEEEAAGNQALVALSEEKLGEAPNYPLASYYQMTKLMIDAVNATGGNDPAAIKEHLAGYSYEGITGTETVAADNNQVEKNFYLLLGKDEASQADKDDFADVVSKGKYFLSAADAGCVR